MCPYNINDDVKRALKRFSTSIEHMYFLTRSASRDLANECVTSRITAVTPDFRRDQQFYTRNQTVIQMGTGVSKKQNSWVVKQTTLCFSVFTYVSVKHVFDMRKDYK